MAKNDKKPPFKVRAKQITEMIALYGASYLVITKLITDAADKGKISKAPLQAAVNAELARLDTQVASWTKAEMTQYYADGSNSATKGLRAAGATISKTGMSKLDKEAVANIVDTTTNGLREAIRGVSRNASNIISDTVRQQLKATIDGQLDSELRKTIAKDVAQQLADSGLSALTDSAGRSWSFERYAEMLVTTDARNARNDGVANQMLQNGYDLAQISDTNSDHQACADHEGEVISITGKTDGYESLSEVTDDGIFHPNCQHVYDPVEPALAKDLKIYENPTYGSDAND